MPVQTQMQVRRGTASSWTSTNPTLAAGELGFETDTGKFKIGTGSSTWTGLAYATGLNAITYLYNATAAQTTFSGADANGLTLAYTVGTEQVFLNGALQVRGSDYTATNGTSIVLTSGALVGDVLNVIAYGATTITDTYTQAQADAKFVQQTTNFFAGKNKIINGDFGIWQRGTSFAATSATAVYSADRWNTYQNGSGTFTVSQQAFTAGSAPVAGYENQFFIRNAITTLGTTTAFVFAQRIEDVRNFAGQTVTVSFWSKSLTGLGTTVGFSQNFGAGGSSPVSISGSNITNTTSWQRFSQTIAIPSITGKTIGTSSYFELQFTSSLTANQSIDIWGVQVEAGSTATPFETATGTIQGELAACQRYYYRTTADASNTAAKFGVGSPQSSTTGYASVVNPVPLRVPATSIDFANLAYINFGLSSFAASGLVLAGGSQSPTMSFFQFTGSGMTAGQFGWIQSNSSSSGYIGFSAEL